MKAGEAKARQYVSVTVPGEVLAMHRRLNRQVRLKSRPSGIPRAEHFEIVEAPVPAPADGQVLVRNIYLSVDPAMRGWVSAAANYADSVALGAVMRSLAVGRVEESRDSGFRPGEYVTGMFGWQDYAVADAKMIERKVGTASIASWDPPPNGPRVERHLLVKRARMQGFLIFDHVQRYPEALQELENWVRNGQIRYREDILDGIEQAPGSIAELYRGKNLGKRLIRIAPEIPA
jgi:NADPH-dependent curcumin reductase CurA